MSPVAPIIIGIRVASKLSLVFDTAFEFVLVTDGGFCLPFMRATLKALTLDARSTATMAIAFMRMFMS